MLAGLKIMLLVSAMPTQSGEPLETSAVREEESPVDDSSSENSSGDTFWGEIVWYISRLAGGDCFLPMDEFKESHSEPVSCTSLSQSREKRNYNETTISPHTIKKEINLESVTLV